MSQEAQRGLARIRGLFAKAANMGATANDDELEENLEEDFEDLDQATAEAEGGSRPPVEADDSEYDEDEEEEGEAEPVPDEANMRMYGKAADPSDDGDEQDMDAGPILADIAKAWRATNEQMESLRRQNALLAKGLMGLVGEQETLAKSLDGVQREVNESARLPKSGRGKPTRRQPQRGEQLDTEALVSKAVQDTERFSARDVSKLESMLNRGDVAGVRRDFDPDQVQALGLGLTN